MMHDLAIIFVTVDSIVVGISMMAMMASPPPRRQAYNFDLLIDLSHVLIARGSRTRLQTADRYIPARSVYKNLKKEKNKGKMTVGQIGEILQSQRVRLADIQ